ncbi:hypothetical protein HO133_002404 [Letharia lupina]|uniref:RING-type domain-containing protein n=1 Tax=Letharia lupina TaxID=560253 RepID=A0A8H6CDI0_9LECA|nr:uncharacterized protein HO133_002404 [Letharia lupina]KAF6221548.1 hypothetical protein HO133_002404 [Letharia lupina]
MDNASAQLAIALQLHDLDELEVSGTADKLVIRLQRQQLEIDSGFDAVTFEASRRLALSMAKAVEDDSALLARSTPLPQIDDTTFDRLALLNHAPSTVSNHSKLAPANSANQTLPSKATSQKRARSLTPEGDPSSVSVNPKEAELRCPSHAALDHVGHSHKKVKCQQITNGDHPRIQVEGSGIYSVQDPQPSTAEASGAQVVKETAAPTTAFETSPTTGDCASCSDHLAVDELVKASCKHYYCKDCFGHFIEASLQTHDGFPPKCCKIPIAFVTVADNVSAVVFSRYSSRQAEIKNATALYCGIQGCGVRIEKGRIEGVRATCVTCWRDTCTQCRAEFPQNVNGRNVGHVCKKDKAHEEVLALAKKEGWQTCYQCGHMTSVQLAASPEVFLLIYALASSSWQSSSRDCRSTVTTTTSTTREANLNKIQGAVRSVSILPGYTSFAANIADSRPAEIVTNFFGWSRGENLWGLRFGARNYDDDTDDEPVSEDQSIEN